MRLLATLIDLYSIIVVVGVVLSWAPQGRRSSLATIVDGLTEPVLVPIRRMLPAVGGLDFSPMVLLILLQALRRLVP